MHVGAAMSQHPQGAGMYLCLKDIALTVLLLRSAKLLLILGGRDSC